MYCKWLIALYSIYSLSLLQEVLPINMMHKELGLMFEKQGHHHKLPFYSAFKTDSNRQRGSLWAAKQQHVGEGMPNKTAVKSYKQRWCRVGRLQLSRCKRACVFQAIMLGEMWKSQSPPVSMETSSRSQAARQSPSTFRIRGVNYSTLFNTCSSTSALLVSVNSISMKMKVSSVAKRCPSIQSSHAKHLKNLSEDYTFSNSRSLCLYVWFATFPLLYTDNLLST